MHYFFICLLLTVAYTEFNEEIKKLEDTQLGKTFLDTVQIAVQSKEPLDRVFQILRDQQQYQESEFLTLDEHHKTYSCKCNKDLQEFDNYGSILKSRVMDLQQALDDKLPLLSKKNNLLQGKRKEKIGLINRIDEVQQTREKQRCVFNTRLEEHQTAIAAVVAVREIFEGALLDSDDSSSSFIQLQDEELDKVENLLGYAEMKAGDFIHLQGYSSLFSVLNQLQVKQIAKHEETVKKLVESCNDLENYIDIARTLLRSVDDIREQYSQRLINGLSQDLRNVNSIIDDLESDISVLEAQIRVLTMDRDEAVQKQDAKLKQRQDRAIECDQEDQVYQLRLQDCHIQRETINRMLTLCLDNVKELKQYMKKRGDQFY